MTFDDFKMLFLSTFRDPKGMAKWLIAQDFPIPARWIALILVAVVSAILGFLGQLALPATLPDEGAAATMPLSAPLVSAVVQIAAITLSAAAMAFVGQIFGGKGRFEDAMVLTAWIEAITIPIKCVHLLLLLLIPPLVPITSIALIVLFFWLTIQFVMALHGFSSTGKVVLGMIGTMLALGVVLLPFAAMLGMLPEMPQ